MREAGEGVALEEQRAEGAEIDQGGWHRTGELVVLDVKVRETGAAAEGGGERPSERVAVEENLLPYRYSDAVGNGAADPRMLKPEHVETLETPERRGNRPVQGITAEQKLVETDKATEECRNGARETVVVHPEHAQLLHIHEGRGDGSGDAVVDQ